MRLARRGHGRRFAAAPFVALLLNACARDANAVRLVSSSPREEIYRVTCKDDIRACRDEATLACKGAYAVLESTGAPVEPPRVTSAPGPTSTGPRYQRRKWVGQMVVVCGDGVPPPAEALQAPSESPSPPLTVAPERLCIPGATQRCLGPAACSGAQACLPDGDGYGPCDCGAQQRPAVDGTDAGAPSGAAAVPR